MEESIFDSINENEDINILLGSRIFTEGWDSNRPNIINFINIGVNDDARKFVLQTIGRGVRIEPVKNERKRFQFLDKRGFGFELNEVNQIRNLNKPLETLFIFVTNKEVIKNILEDLEPPSVWLKINGIEKNKNINEKTLPLLVPEFEYAGLNDRPFKINKDDFEIIKNYMEKAGEKALILKDEIKVRTLKKIKDESNFKFEGRKRNFKSEVLLKTIDNFFNKPIQRLKDFVFLENHIKHYREIRTDLKDELGQIEKEIYCVLNSSQKLSVEEIYEKIKKGEITQKEFEKLIQEISDENEFSGILDYEIFIEHYYVPVLFKENSTHFHHIIKVPGEVEFLKRLKEYTQKGDNKLSEYEWWYFSKIDETVDDIKIPYFDTSKGDYSYFSPDFIFWLKKCGRYYIKFIDPKGKEYIRNPVDKIIGFEEFKQDFQRSKNKKIHNIELYYFNDDKPSEGLEQKYRDYWTNDFDEIFK